MAKKKRMIRKPAIKLNSVNPPSIQDNVNDSMELADLNGVDLVEKALQSEDIIEAVQSLPSDTEEALEEKANSVDEKNRKKIAQVDLEEVKDQAAIWSVVVVCMVLEAKPPFTIFEGFIKRKWGKLGIQQIVRMNGGFTIVKFNNVVTQDLALE
uniref:DUF4283 domain-containing protein n=1 Tax=Cannabis sativa TaxID=3483 RepID=A0A803QAZ2_CANSA